MGKLTKSVLFRLFVGLMMCLGFISCSSTSGDDEKVGLDTVTLTYNESTITATPGNANTTGISPSWRLADTTGITYSIAAAGSDGPVTDGAGTTINIASATGKITITAEAILANSGAYVVTATAGSSSPAYTEDSTASTIITVVMIAGKVGLDTVSLTYNESTITATLGNANTTGISPSWRLADTTGITYSIAEAGTDGPGTDGAGTTINIAPATGKITITDQAIVANSGAYMVTAMAGSTSPAYTEGSTASTTITVRVNVGKVDLSTVALAYDNESTITATLGNANTTGISPSWILADVAGIAYSIAEAGTDGPGTDGAGTTINIAPATGKITITDQAIVANSGAYVVTATAGSTSPVYIEGSTASTTITVRVIEKVDLSTVALAYDNESTITTTFGTKNDDGIIPSWSLFSPTGITYSIAKAGTGGPGTDGAGTTINIAWDTGKITITDKAIVDNSGAYVVTATAGSTSPAYTDGSTASTTITVTVSKVNLNTKTLTYNSDAINVLVGNANTTGISPSWILADVAGIAYSIAAAGTDGPGTDGAGTTINIDSTGKITITAEAIVDNSGAYTVTATAGSTSPVYTEGSTASTTITVRVNVGKVDLSTVALAYYNEGAITTANGTANDEGVLPSWSLASPTGIVYSIAAAGTDGPVTDGAGTTVNIASATGKITITDQAIVANSGAYVVTATAGSTSPAYTEDSTASTTITVDVTYKVGDVGPAGGKIFYVNENYETDRWRYLEAAPSSQGVYQWGSDGEVETSTDIGTGSTNTANIVAALAALEDSADYAAKICSELVEGGYADWFLPSKGELYELYKQRDAVDDFSSYYRWSSSGDGSDKAWGRSFGSGAPYVYDRGDEGMVRAVRAF